MKKTILLLSILFTLSAYSQNKFSVSIIADYHTSFLSNTNIDIKTLSYAEVSRTQDTITLNKNLFNYAVNSSYTSKPAFSIGARAAYRLNEKLTFIAGVAITSFSITKTNTTTTALVSTQQVRGPYSQNPPNTLPPYSINFPLERTGFESLASYYYVAKQEKIQFNAIKIPVGVLISPAKSKFNLGAELVPTVIQKYKVTPSPSTDPEGFTLNAFTEAKTLNLSASISIGYQINKYLSANVYYQQFFNSIVEGKAAQDLVPKLAGISLITKIPSLK